MPTLGITERKILRRIRGVTLLYKIRNEDSKKCKTHCRNDQGSNDIRWFGRVNRSKEQYLTKIMWKTRVEGNKGRGRRRKRWEDQVKQTCALKS